MGFFAEIEEAARQEARQGRRKTQSRTSRRNRSQRKQGRNTPPLPRLVPDQVPHRPRQPRLLLSRRLR